MKVRRTKTANRILEVSLDLFNRFGEPNVAPATIAQALGMSTGNLYYHYPSKAELINTLLDDYVQSIERVLPAASDVQSVEDTWFFLHTLFELIDAYRFLYRDMSDLLSKNREYERQIKSLIAKKNSAFESALHGLVRHHVMRINGFDVKSVATCMTVLITYWLSYEYIKNPRQALDPEHAPSTLLQGAFHVLNLLSPYLMDESREHLRALSKAYL